MPIKNSVQLTYHTFRDAEKALEKMNTLIGACDFLDGILFAKDHCVIMEGHLIHAASKKHSSQWFAHKVKENKGDKTMPLFDYLFRYDQGAFWMGNFLFSPPFLFRYLSQGMCNMPPSQGWFTEHEIGLFNHLPYPKALTRSFASPWMSSQRLWSLLHKAEKWVQDRLIIQDLCIPVTHASSFLAEILKDPATFPLWLCPIKGNLHSSSFCAPPWPLPIYQFRHLRLPIL